MGAYQMVREVAAKHRDRPVREGARLPPGMNPMDLKRGIDLAAEAVVADLVKNSKQVTSNEEIAPGRHHLGQWRHRDRSLLSGREGR